ncbi:hypothetical protein GGR21_002659 [Dysgonomonas hofstadii]|uniref:DUF4249 domain-containing protein n=1 Tax=Dysgonomonas hofstadii TaxID=637886 RepID=A0A840CMX6_9BACT|nr:DUF4249 domain-containing protein [Dysgonomonas hofstadii]MBB4036746.1 hypothetical protein [Dysgonomonas hofstadii]
MKKLKIKYTAILFTLTLLFTISSCEKEIDVDLRSITPRIQIEGIVKQDQLATVRVSQTLDFNDNSGYPFLEGAIVRISDDAGNSETLLQNSTGWYVAENIKGEIGRTYTLSVTYEENEYTATSKIPPLVKLDSLTMYKAPIMDYAIPMIHYTDPKGEANQYYRALVYINGEQLPDMWEQVYSCEFTDGSPMHDPLAVFTNDNDNDPIKKGDEILIEFQCIDKGVYTFFDTLSKIEDKKTNPISNISGGALGYFCASTVDQMTIIADWVD